MKLLSCHIETFGNLSGADYTFDGSLTAFCEENGYGKTTLAAFLKAMFYGLETDRQKVSFNDRRRYFPFSGGTFGGNVTFEANGSRYKIERFFDEKSETKDSLTVYRDGILLPVPDGSVGRALFGVDKQSFERTVFLSGTEIEIASTGDINQKINAFAEGDDSNFEKALSLLEAKRKEYKLARGEGGLIFETRTRLNALSIRIGNAKSVANSLREKNAALAETDAGIAALSARIAAAQSENVLIANRETYDGMLAENAETERKLRLIEENYPFGIPAREEVERVGDAIGKLRDLNAKLSHEPLTEEENARYLALQTEFSSGVPSDTDLDTAQSLIDRAAKLAYEAETLGAARLSPKEQRLMQKFAYGCPSAEEVENVGEQAKRYRALEAEYASPAEPDKAAPPAAPKTRALLPAVMAVLSVLLLAGGAATVFFSTLAGAILLVGGVLLLIAAGFIYLNRKASARTGEMRSSHGEDAERARARRQADALYSAIAAVLLPYGYSFEHGVAYAVACFEEDVKAYGELRAAAEEDAKRLRALTAEQRELSERLDRFFAAYGLRTGGAADRLRTLRLDVRQYKFLYIHKTEWAKNKQLLETQREEPRRLLFAFCSRYKLTYERLPDEIRRIGKDIADHDTLAETLRAGREKAERFKAEKEIAAPTSGREDLDALNRELVALQDKKNRLYTEIVQCEREAELLGDLQSEYDEVQLLLETYKRDYERLGKVIDALTRADRKLKDRYIKPIRDRFVFYADCLERALGEKLVMNTDFEIRFERGGKERSDRHLSTGQRVLCALCFRLALIDNMYAEEKPFVILDDPFAALDEAHILKAKALLSDLSRQMQIIYFTCHPSRAL